MEKTVEKRKRKRRRKSLGRYFRDVFNKHPQWLDLKSNDLMQAQFEKDHPGRKMTKSIRANMANIKSVMRKDLREGGKKRKAGSAGSDSGINDLESLEVAIDHCLSSARVLDTGGLETVIKALRKARYELVLQMGEP